MTAELVILPARGGASSRSLTPAVWSALARWRLLRVADWMQGLAASYTETASTASLTGGAR